MLLLHSDEMKTFRGLQDDDMMRNSAQCHFHIFGPLLSQSCILTAFINVCIVIWCRSDNMPGNLKEFKTFKMIMPMGIEKLQHQYVKWYSISTKCVIQGNKFFYCKKNCCSWNVYVSVYKSVNWLFDILLRFFFQKKCVVLLDY